MFTSENNVPRSRIPDFPSYHPPIFSRITNNQAISIRVILSNNTRHCTPLECRHGDESRSIDIALRWSAHAERNRVLLTLHRIYYRAPYSVA